MSPIPSGRIEVSTAQAISGDRGIKCQRFIFSDLDALDPEGEYKVIVCEFFSIGGTPLKVEVGGKVITVRFRESSLQQRFGQQNWDAQTLYQSVLLAKATLLKKRATCFENPGHHLAWEEEPQSDLRQRLLVNTHPQEHCVIDMLPQNKETGEFCELVGLLYEGPERTLAAPSASALKELCRYSKELSKTIRLSAEAFGLQNSYTIQGDWVAEDITDEAITRSIDGFEFGKARQICPTSGLQLNRFVEPISGKAFKNFTLFPDTPYVINTLATVAYINKQGQEVLAYYQPCYGQNLLDILRDKLCRDFPSQLRIACQILKGMELINKKGVHRNLYPKSILVRKEQGEWESSLGDLLYFVPHEESCAPLKIDSSAPEVRSAENPAPPHEKQDVWQLGLIFFALFQNPFNEYRHFRGYSQEQINSHIRKREFPPPLAVMIEGMLQIDPLKRWSMQQLLHHFFNEVLQNFWPPIDSLRNKSMAPEDLLALQAYAKKYGKAIRFSRTYFNWVCSVTATPDLVALDIKKETLASNRAKIKLALLPDGTKVARRICPYESTLVKTLRLFGPQTPHLVPTLGMVDYTNKKGKYTLVSYHPLFDMDLSHALFVRTLQFDDKTKLGICHQILLGLEEIHKKGVHGDLHAGNIFLNRGPTPHAVIADLEMFKPHGAAAAEWGLTTKSIWSPPEVRDAQAPPPAATSHDIWSLGLIFHSLFQKHHPERRFFGKSNQEEILADIQKRKFSPPVAEMIIGMLQTDLQKRWTLEQIIQHFKQNILQTPTPS